ncbi:uncharacterized protein BDW47DRAFT_106478 [Aspergillus candidus]|uniref:Uncharacterized protein n=1 Tax=Aspergillus candidus TaxID=41067 RepID=A0A2I2FAE6_ASPCN|nr:hypothetical protein BDW47DRAFT_106478 [Aspergillus candidus]PLB37599.1 hypothetical protein BDW47DRAFT_106478 [Aspergillus candidus]
MALVRDPMFWRRFSRAIHLDEEAKGLSPPNESKPVAGSGETVSSISSSSAEIAAHEKVPSIKKSAVCSDEWLQNERRKRNRSIIRGMIGIGVFAAIIIVVVVVLWWLSRHNWMRD